MPTAPTVPEILKMPAPAAGVSGAGSEVSPPAVPARIRILVAVMSALALVGLALLWVLEPLPAGVQPDAFAAVVLVVACSYVQGVYVFFSPRRHRIAFSFSEIGALVALVVLPGVLAPLGMVLGVALHQALVRQTPIKAAFNLAQDALGITATALLLLVLPPLGPAAGRLHLASAAIALLGFVVVSTVSKILLLRALTERPSHPIATASIRVDVVAALGSISTGIIGVNLWMTAPILILFVIVPLGAVIVAYRTTLAAQELVRERTSAAERLDQLVTSASDGIILLDEDRTVRVWNPVLEDLTGLAMEDAIGHRLDQLLPRIERTAPVELAAQSRTTAVWGEGRMMEEDASTVSDGAGETAGVVIVLRDITREQETETLKHDFIARVSHELRTPLTPLMGFIELLRTQDARFGPEARTTALEAMARNTERMQALVEQLLLVTELDGGTFGISATDVSVATALGAALGRLRLDAAGRDLRVDVPPELAAAGDAASVIQVLGNLLDNAVRYSPGGTGVDVSAHVQDDHVLVRIHDEGPGIPRTAQELVFERFTRLENPLLMRTNGLGLGLFISRRLAAAMGGSLAVAPSATGTTMELRLPLGG